MVRGVGLACRKRRMAWRYGECRGAVERRAKWEDDFWNKKLIGWGLISCGTIILLKEIIPF